MGAPMRGTFDVDDCVAMLLPLRASTLRQRAAAGGAGLFVLMDPLTGDPLLRDPLPADLNAEALNAARGEAWGRPCHSLSLPPLLELDPALAPYLVELTGADDPWLEITLEWALRETVRSWLAPVDGQPPHRMGGWLHSAAFGPALAQKLSGWLVLSTRTPTPARYLRVADRRAWGLVVHVLGEGALARRLAPVQCWQWIDAQAACRELVAAYTEHGADEATGPLARFSAAQWQLLARGEQVHGFMARQQGLRLGDSNDNPAQWPPVSAAQWHHALEAVGAVVPIPIQKKNASQEGNNA
jgi:hypothetical protein